MGINYLNKPELKHARLAAWVEEWAELMTPDAVYFADGSKE